MRKVMGLTLLALAACNHTPVEPIGSPPPAAEPSLSTPEGPIVRDRVESHEDESKAQMIPESSSTTIVPPRPAQTEQSAPGTTILRDTSDSTVRSCIARYESGNGASSSNVYQFTQTTWRVYGGTGSPENASLAEQNRIFDLAWADAGRSHWAAQRGRCF